MRFHRGEIISWSTYKDYWLFVTSVDEENRRYKMRQLCYRNHSDGSTSTERPFGDSVTQYAEWYREDDIDSEVFRPDPNADGAISPEVLKLLSERLDAEYIDGHMTNEQVDGFVQRANDLLVARGHAVRLVGVRGEDAQNLQVTVTLNGPQANLQDALDALTNRIEDMSGETFVDCEVGISLQGIEPEPTVVDGDTVLDELLNEEEAIQREAF